MKLALSDIGIYPSLDELELYFKRYDKDGDGRLKFSEFCDSFTPLDNYYATLLNRRTSNNIRGRAYARDDCFESSTKLEFRSVWRTHFKIEVFAEQLRQRLNSRPGFNIFDAFLTCDMNENGLVSREELKRLIESRGFYVSEKEINTLVEKIDRDKDGKISYAEVSSSFLGIK
jgi:Ca2+-binding EF-hand superfamily protein